MDKSTIQVHSKQEQGSLQLMLSMVTKINGLCSTLEQQQLRFNCACC